MGIRLVVDGEWIDAFVRGFHDGAWTVGNETAMVYAGGEFVTFQNPSPFKVAAPVNVVAQPASTSVTVSWDPAPANELATHTQVRVPAASEHWFEVARNVTELIVGQLAPSTTYGIEVRHVVRPRNVGVVTATSMPCVVMFKTAYTESQDSANVYVERAIGWEQEYMQDAVLRAPHPATDGARDNATDKPITMGPGFGWFTSRYNEWWAVASDDAHSSGLPMFIADLDAPQLRKATQITATLMVKLTSRPPSTAAGTRLARFGNCIELSAHCTEHGYIIEARIASNNGSTVRLQSMLMMSLGVEYRIALMIDRNVGIQLIIGCTPVAIAAGPVQMSEHEWSDTVEVFGNAGLEVSSVAVWDRALTAFEMSHWA